MGRKQLKIALSEDFYQELNKVARKHKIPVSTYARSLIASALKQPLVDSALEAPVNATTIPTTPKKSSGKDKDEDVILLSDVLSGNDGAEQIPTTKTINPEGKQPVNIQIIFNN